MKKPKSIKTKDNPQQKLNEPSPDKEIKKSLISRRKTYRKEKTLPTKANTTMTESSKEDKKEKEKKDISLKKRIINEKSKITKSNLSFTLKEKTKNKTIELDLSSSKKRKIKKHRNSTKIKASLSQSHLGKLKTSKSSKMNLKKNKTLNKTFLLSYNKTESSNNILLGSDDNFIKTLLSKYMDGTDDIINEDSEAFNNIKSNIDNENISMFDDDNDNTEVHTAREHYDNSKKDSNNIDKTNSNKDNLNLNSIKHNKKEKKIMIKITNSENNKIKSNLCKSFINSPSRTKEERISIDFNKSHNKIISIKKKFSQNIPNKIKNLAKLKKSVDFTTKSSNSNEKLKRKKQYSTKIINTMAKLKQNNKNKTEVYTIKKEIMPIIATNLNLDIIFENNKLKHHYLENTVSAKNKMVQKKQITTLEQPKNIITNNNDINNNNLKISEDKLRLDKTPKAKKNIKDRFSFSIKNINNNLKNNNGRKFSQHIKNDLSLENSISGKNIITSKIFKKKLDDYLITRELGKGSYAVVKLAVDKMTKNKYAIKIYTKQCLIDPQLRSTVKNEINILKQIDNENVMKLYEVIDTQSHLYLVLEYINGINLLEIIKNEKYHYIKESRAKKIFLKVVSGIGYCHQINIYHRDIKLENILVLKDDSVKIIDFGFGIICKADTYQKLFCGTKSYMPPEIVKKEKYIASYSDIWSLGVLFYAMLFGIFPFKGKDEDELFEKIIEAKVTFPDYNPISDKTKELFEKIFVINPSDRISIDEMINYLKEE